MRTVGFSHSLQRRESHYQHKRQKEYAETQSFLKALQMHPEILRPLSSPKPLNALQTVLFLSAITAAFPTRTQAAAAKTSFNPGDADSNVANALVTPGSQPSQQAAKASSLAPPLSPMHRMYGLLNSTQFASPLKWISSEVSLNRILRNVQDVSAQATKKASVKKTSHKNPQHSMRTKTKNKCTSAPRHPHQTINRLHAWVNQTAAIEKVVSHPSHALGAVLYHYQVDLPESFFTALNPCVLRPSDWRWMDEAAQLWHEAQQRQSTATTTTTSLSPQNATDGQHVNIKSNHSIRGLRKKFLAALKLDLEKETLLGKIFAPVVNSTTSTEIFFDGTALRGAMGKSFDDLVASPALMQIPEYAPLIDLAKKELLIAKLKRIGESRDYTVGTAAYSLDSVVQRYRAFHGQPAEYFANEKALLEQFSAIAQRWQTQHDYPIDPQLALAQHLVHARGVEIRSPDWQTTFLQDEVNPWLENFLISATPMQRREINSWFYTTRMQATFDEPLERKSAQTICEELQEIAYCARVPVSKRPQSLQAAHFYIAREAPNEHYEKAGLCSTDGTIPAAIVTFAQTMQEKGALPRGEVIVGDTPQQRYMALSAYRDDVFSSNYGAPPRFNRNQAVRTILHQHGLNDTQIDACRFYNTGPNLGVGATLVQDKEGTGIDEFLERSKKEALSDGAIMSITTANGTTQLKTTGLLREVMRQWDNDLHTQPWIQARARENLRWAQAPITHTTVSAEAHQVAENYKIGIAEQDIAGAENMLISLIPFFGGLYNIEEGIRHKNIDQAIGGVFSLALDSFTGGVGAMAEIEAKSLGATLKVPHTERAMVGMMKGVASDLDMSLDELAPRHAATDGIGMHVHADPWKISLPDTNVPSAHRSLASRVRQGEENVMWTAPTGKQYPVIRVVNQDRIIPVKHVGGTYHEVSWKNGEVLHHAPLIHHNKQGKFYFSMGLKGGGPPKPSLIVGGVKLKHRYNVATLKASLDAIAVPISHIADTLEDVKTLFSTRFHVLADTLSIDNHLYANAFKHSQIFRNLANRFFLETDNSWVVEFTGNGPPHVATSLTGRISPHPKIILPSEDTFPNLRYWGIDSRWHPFTREQINLDAALAAMNPVPATSGSTLASSRSPNIILRERIIFDMGYPPLPEQFSSLVMTTNANGEFASTMRLHDAPPLVLNAEQIKIFALENSLMDSWLDQRLKLRGDTRILGTTLAERTTVQDIKHFHQRLLNTEFSETIRLTDAFEFYSQSTKEFYKKALKKSHLLDLCWIDAYYEGRIGGHQWRFITSSESTEITPSLIATARNRGSAIDAENRIIYLPIDTAPHLHYLSEEGFTTLELERKLLDSMVEVLTDIPIPTTDPWLNRGGEVCLVEQILSEIKVPLPARLSYGLLNDQQVQDGVFIGTGTNPIIYQTAARRARDMENEYLEGPT